MHRSNRFSRLFGRFARTRFPAAFQNLVNKVYVSIFKLDLSDFKSYKEYKSLNDLFTRRLEAPRPLHNKPFNLISPTDSVITELGRIRSGTALQIKGMRYSVAELLFGRNSNGACIDLPGGLDSYSFLNLYLSPRDYHHYHAPCDLEVLQARYFSGCLLPVNMASLTKNENLFIRNERVVLTLRLAYNQSLAYFVAVGALNVGGLRLSFDDRLQSNAKAGDGIYNYDPPIALKAGDHLGNFEMGSTVVLIARANWTLSRDSVVRMGEEVGTLPLC